MSMASARKTLYTGRWLIYQTGMVGRQTWATYRVVTSWRDSVGFDHQMQITYRQVQANIPEVHMVFKSPLLALDGSTIQQLATVFDHTVTPPTYDEAEFLFETTTGFCPHKFLKYWDRLHGIGKTIYATHHCPDCDSMLVITHGNEGHIGWCSNERCDREVIWSENPVARD